MNEKKKIAFFEQRTGKLCLLYRKRGKFACCANRTRSFSLPYRKNAAICCAKRTRQSLKFRENATIYNFSQMYRKNPAKIPAASSTESQNPNSFAQTATDVRPVYGSSRNSPCDTDTRKREGHVPDFHWRGCFSLLFSFKRKKLQESFLVK